MKQSLRLDKNVKTVDSKRTIIIEQMRQTDLDQVLNIEEELFGKDAWNKEMFEHDLSSGYAKYWSLKIKCECDSSLEMKCENDSPLECKVIGYAGIYLLPPEVEISNVAVSKEFQKNGYSNLLMEKMIEESALVKAQSVFLEVDVSNTAAIALYEKFRFLKVGIRKNYYGMGKDAFVMKLEL